MLCPLVCAKCVDVLVKAVPWLPPSSALRVKLFESLLDALFSLPGGKLQVRVEMDDYVAITVAVVLTVNDIL